MSHLYIICGPAGAGKSTYGRKLAFRLGACFLDSDTVTEPVVRAGLELAGLEPNDRDSALYKETFRDAVYNCLWATARENLPQVPVVIVGPFTREIQNPAFKDDLEKEFGVPVSIIFVSCDEKIRKARIQARGNPRDEAKLLDWEGYLSGSNDTPPVCPHEKVESER